MTFVPRPDDIYIVSYPRSGTSLVQMILYQLMSDGQLNFDHISQVMPFLERSLRAGDSLENLSSPRVFKTHLPYGHISKLPGKYIYVVREGKDVLLSYYHLYKAYVNPKIQFGDFFPDFLTGRVQYGSWFQHVAIWMRVHVGSNILFLRYEDLVDHLELCANSLASFCGWSLPDKKRPLLVERCSFTFMREHESKFAPEVGRPGNGAESVKGKFIRQGLVGAWKKELTEGQDIAFRETARLYGLFCE